MLETLLAIKNNNKLKILQIESDYVDHLKKCMKTFVHHGKYVSELKITFEDLLNGIVTRFCSLLFRLLRSDIYFLNL